MAELFRELTRPVKMLEHLLLLLPAFEQPPGHALRILRDIFAGIQSVEENSLARLAVSEHDMT